MHLRQIKTDLAEYAIKVHSTSEGKITPLIGF